MNERPLNERRCPNEEYQTKNKEITQEEIQEEVQEEIQEIQIQKKKQEEIKGRVKKRISNQAEDAKPENKFLDNGFKGKVHISILKTGTTCFILWITPLRMFIKVILMIGSLARMIYIDFLGQNLHLF